jgi:hypothetical protein
MIDRFDDVCLTRGTNIGGIHTILIISEADYCQSRGRFKMLFIRTLFAVTLPKCRFKIGVEPEPLNCLFVSQTGRTDRCVTFQGVVPPRSEASRSVDLDRCQRWAFRAQTMEKHLSLSMHPCPFAKHAYLLTCICASTPCSPGSYMYVHIRSYSHVACCVRQVVCSQPRTCQLVHELCFQHSQMQSHVYYVQW